MIQKLLSITRKAVDEYKLIEEGDRIAVGVSGGKDSLCVLTALAALRRFYPVSYDVQAVTIDMGFGLDFRPVAAYCDELGVPLTIVPTQIKEVVFDIRKEENPCSLCAKLRRGAVNNAALDLGCNKVAYGHHLDDAVETFLMCLFYEGRLGCFSPKTFLDRSGVTVIRPMVYVDEWFCEKFAREQRLPVVEKKCPADGNTKREETKQLVELLRGKFPDLKDRVLGAMQRGLKDWKPVGEVSAE